MNKKNVKKKKYIVPEIKMQDLKKMASDWHYGVYGDVLAIPAGCSC